MAKAEKRSPRRARPTTAGDLLAACDQLAPFTLAEDWDNVGLLAGRAGWPGRRALVAIDLTDAVADEALRRSVDVVIAYHPPIFKGIRAVTPAATAPTTKLPDLLAARVSIIALHTALDAAAGGTNDVLLDAFATEHRFPLEPHIVKDAAYKLVTFVPPAEAASLRAALAAAGAGRIGHYTECSYELDGRGTFRGDATTHPTIGRKLQLEQVAETRLEMLVPRSRLGDVVRALYATHRYEEPAFDLYPTDALPHRATVGMGRVAVLKKPTRGTDLLKQLGAIADLACAQVVGDVRRRFTSVTAAAGAFGVRAFRDPDSLYITGEFKHHDALELVRHGITAVPLGHAQSERPVLPHVCAFLKRRVPGLKIEIARADRGPFVPCAAVMPRG